MSSYPNDWVQLNYFDDNQTAIPPITTSGGGGGGSGGSSAPRNNDQPLDHGRGARPIRRRSRASRRTPTTLLNTDATNFRAMVQQFTGSSATTTPAAVTPHLTSAAGIFDFRQQIVPNQGGGAHVQYPFPNQMHMEQRRYFGDTHGRRGGGGGAHEPPESSAPNGSRGYDNYMF